MGFHGRSMKPRNPLQELRVIVPETPVDLPTLICRFGKKSDPREQLRNLKDLSVGAQFFLYCFFKLCSLDIL